MRTFYMSTSAPNRYYVMAVMTQDNIRCNVGVYAQDTHSLDAIRTMLLSVPSIARVYPIPIKVRKV